MTRAGSSQRSTAVRVECLRKWKRPQLGANGRYVKQPMHVVVGDTVQVVAGSDKGKVTEVTAVRPETSEVCCRDVRVVTKHQKPQSEGEAGQIVRFESWLHSSNVMHYSKEGKVRSRVGTRCGDCPCTHSSSCVCLCGDDGGEETERTRERERERERENNTRGAQTYVEVRISSMKGKSCAKLYISHMYTRINVYVRLLQRGERETDREREREMP